MFKRGDIFVGKETRRLYLCLGDCKYYNITAQEDSTMDDPRHHESYTGPIYEKDKQRFVPSGEFRLPKDGEWILPNKSDSPFLVGCNYKRDCYVILLPVPTFEPEEAECKLCRGTGVCRDCVHEFSVGDWVKDTGGHVWKVGAISTKLGKLYPHDGGEGVVMSACTKLPGRPLTTDDLMRVQSGIPVWIKCDACHCAKNDDAEGYVYTVVDKGTKGHGTVSFYHENGHDENHVNFPVASYKDGSIVFSPDVEGSIYVIEEKI